MNSTIVELKTLRNSFHHLPIADDLKMGQEKVKEMKSEMNVNIKEKKNFENLCSVLKAERVYLKTNI